jgi:hypothetical protein
MPPPRRTIGYPQFLALCGALHGHQRLPVGRFTLPHPIPALSCPIPSVHPTSTPRTESHPNALSPSAGEWKPVRVWSKKEGLRNLIGQSTQQFKSYKYWSDFAGKCKYPRGDLYPDVQHLPHHATHLLNRLRVSGETVVTKSAPWTLHQKLAALDRGSHQSAKHYVEFLCGEFGGMIEKRHLIVLPAKLILHNHNLRLRPLGVVPHRERRPWTICDYSFFLINQDTVELCPKESMQFGRAF